MIARLWRFLRIFSRTMHYVSYVRRATGARPFAPEAQLHRAMREWSKEVLDILNVEVEIAGAPPSPEPVIFIGNHIGYLDIPLLMYVTPVVFIAKKQLKSWPVFGPACSVVGTVFVDRDSAQSRRDARLQVLPALRDRRQSLAVFPSGTTTLDESREWRRGIFQIAQTHDLWVQPFRIRYDPLPAVGFLLEDAFVPHLWRLLGTPKIRARVEFLPPRKVTSIDDNAQTLRDWCRASDLFSSPTV